ncbi:MAG: ArsR/SmtB family transcription factor [Candidatus Hodarchaeales archaeon]
MRQIYDNKKIEEAKEVFKQLTHPIRLKILQLLVIESEICTSELTELSDQPQPAITKQLTNLKNAGILTSRKVTFKGKDGQWTKKESEDGKGKWTAYCLAKDKKDLITYLLLPFIDNKFLPRLKIVNLKVPDLKIVNLIQGCQ